MFKLLRPLKAGSSLISIRHSARFNSNLVKDDGKPSGGALNGSSSSSSSLEKLRTTQYEYPKNPQFNIPPHVKEKSNDNWLVRYGKYIPIAIALGVGAWSFYSVYYFTNPDAGKSGQEILSPDHFTEFMITKKKEIDDDHFIIELAPRVKSDFLSKFVNSKGYWDGSKLWSVEVKQPEIMVVRKYTPLPVILAKAGEEGQLAMRLISEEGDVGKFCLYIKKYQSGEVARWISKRPVGSILEIRGPYTEYQFKPQPIDRYSEFERPKMQNLPSKVPSDPYTASFLPQGVPLPDNLVFYGAGTGIAPVLQLLLSKNPFKGHVWINYSFKKQAEVPEEFLRLFYFLEKMGRITLQTFDESKNQYLTNVMTPSTPNIQEIETDPEIELEVIKQRIVAEKMKQLKQNGEATNDDTLGELEKLFKETEAKITVGKPKESNPPPTTKTSELTSYNNALHQGYIERDQPKKDPSLAIICGPEGYIGYVAGRKPTELQQGKVAGLLGNQGWDEANVFKM
ncbi:oxidoreductase [Saccharomycopsis crataegensis]|uniref:Oxidoreductase n=1 Tax=Saccharomycopsis crataegensis TaxID=43959 RepID=A0AAV5QRX6_9ASCO|nr:oxidoreductase [Saccharomycopsis crataegensis]